MLSYIINLLKKTLFVQATKGLDLINFLYLISYSAKVSYIKNLKPNYQYDEVSNSNSILCDYFHSKPSTSSTIQKEEQEKGEMGKGGGKEHDKKRILK